jgi:glycine dehydrogenase subunit 2
MKASGFQQARWNEPVIMELSTAGERAMIAPRVEPAIAERGYADSVPPALRRTSAPALPEVAQPQVYRHFLHLSQEVMGAAVSIEAGQGTATMKYNPPASEAVVAAIGLADVHPETDPDAMQGILAMMHRLEHVLKELSGLDRFSFQSGGGSQGIMVNANIIRAYHASRGEARTRDEIITSLFSHPSNPAAAATAGYKVITVYPGDRGYIEVDAVKAVLSERTAGFMVSNPEDTGIFNPHIDEIVRLVHDAGGICAHDMANANGLLTITRTIDSGFDLCQFNLHKTFGAPHYSGGPACGAVGATPPLSRFLPIPLVSELEGRYVLEYDRPESIGRVRAFLGVVGTVLRAYAWAASLGGPGLRAAAESAVLNNVYLARRLEEVVGIHPSYAAMNRHPRLEQVRYTMAEIAAETGVSTEELARRSGDYGVSGYFPGHHPWLVPEPATLEPTETPSRGDLDTYVGIIASVVADARSDPEKVRDSPYFNSSHLIDPSSLDDPARWALTWRAHVRKSHRRGALVD